MSNVLDELERLSKEATPGPWRVDEETAFNRILSECRHNVADVGPKRHFSPGKTVCGLNAELITTMRNNIDALIQVARAAESVRRREEIGDYGHEGIPDLIEALEKLK